MYVHVSVFGGSMYVGKTKDRNDRMRESVSQNSTVLPVLMSVD